MKRIVCLVVIGTLLAFTASAQDTTRKRSVDITSSFKPILRDAAKINFNASPPAADTTKPRLQYSVPNQHLLFPYQPGSLKPLALQTDTVGKWDNSNYVKAGFGSLKTPYVQAGFSFGDGQTAGVDIYAKHVSSQGKREYQDFSNTQASIKGFYKTAGGLEWNAGLGMKAERTYKYGYEPETLSFDKDSIRQRFQTISGRLAMRNIRKTEYELSYAPELRIDVFGDHLKNNESNTVLTLPLEKAIGKDFSAGIKVGFDLTRLSPDEKNAINNTVWYVAPGVQYKSAQFNIQAGIRPSWDNGEFKMFPNVLAEAGTRDQRLVVQAGWTGYVRKTTYQYLASQNPWLWAPERLNNTWVQEIYGGIKGALGDHFTYNARFGVTALNNQPLFINDTSAAGDGKSFAVVYEDKMSIITMGGEVGYNVQEKFSVTAGIKLNQFSGLRESNAKAWGLLPMEFNAALRLLIMKDLWFKTDIFAWDGPHYLKKDATVGKLSGAFDLNAGLEFKITRNLNLWAQFNNITNKEYQRWNQYPVYGFNFVGGIVYSFAQKN
jgi:hypothetical protein